MDFLNQYGSFNVVDTLRECQHKRQNQINRNSTPIRGNILISMTHLAFSATHASISVILFNLCVYEILNAILTLIQLNDHDF